MWPVIGKTFKEAFDFRLGVGVIEAVLKLLSNIWFVTHFLATLQPDLTSRV